jgi:hypothetical protein
MRLTYLLYSIALISLCNYSNAQSVTPTIAGNVKISIKKGTFECDLTMSDIPDITDYVIRLNSGMNIRYFKDMEAPGPLYYDVDKTDTLSYGETIAYYLHENIGNRGRYLPKNLKLKYGGMYPVIPDSAGGYMSQDWRGNVAFNGYSLRVDGFQAAWYPVLFDKKKQVEYHKVNYNITITCQDCKVLFVNGSDPIKGDHATFKSDEPREMALYCGDFETAELKNTWILNPDMNKLEQKDFLNVTNSFKNYYEKNLSIPFKGNMTFVQTTPVASPDIHAFAFVVSPTILNVGIGQYGMHAMFDEASGLSQKKTIAHELAHYYFGTTLHLNSDFGPVISEGFAEYLALKAIKNTVGGKSLEELVKTKLDALKNRPFTPFSLIRSEKDFRIREYYVYYYAPILFLAIEEEIGEKQMWKWLRTIISSNPSFTNYAFLEDTFKESISDPVVAKKVINKYFTSNNALFEASKLIAGQTDKK